MKRIKVLGLVLSAALLLGLLSGCNLMGTTPIPKEMDEQVLLTAGEEVLDLLLDEEYETVLGMLREDVRLAEGKEITAQHIRDLVDVHADPEEVGTFVKVDDSTTMGQTEPEPMGTAVFKCEYTEKEVAFGFAYDIEMNLIGISIAHS